MRAQAALALSLLLAAAAAASGPEPAPGQETVETLCLACHSLAIVEQQRLNRRVWDEVLVWMVEEQGMPELEPEERQAVLDYLAQTYGAEVPR